MFFFDVVRYIPRIPQNGEKRVEKKGRIRPENGREMGRKADNGGKGVRLSRK